MVFLRVLWIIDGLSQRELSARVGVMEPTTVIALRSMECAGLIERVRGHDNRLSVFRRVITRMTVNLDRIERWLPIRR